VEIDGVNVIAHKRPLRDWELLLKNHDKRAKGGKNRWAKPGKKTGAQSEGDDPETVASSSNEILLHLEFTTTQPLARKFQIRRFNKNVTVL
jgi:hypothetical protein